MNKALFKLTVIAVTTAMCLQTFAAELKPEEAVRVRDDLVDETIPVDITIDESNIICEADDKMLGIQYEPSGSTFSLSDNDNSTDLDQKYLEMADRIYDIPLARNGGGTVENLSFMHNIGAYKTRTSSSINSVDTKPGYEAGKLTSDPQRFGPVEWVKSVQASNPNAAFIPCISMTSATPEENAQFVQFMLDEKEKSTWGAMRAGLGLEEPVNVFAFELGNEIDGSKKTGWGFDREVLEWYKVMARKNIDAIKAVCPQAKLMICGKTSPEIQRGPWCDWTLELCKEFGNDVEYMSFHQYYGGYHLAYTRPYRDFIWEDIKAALGEDTKMKIVITEHAKWYSAEGSADMIQLTAVLNTGLFLARMYRRPEVVGATYHGYTGSGTWWSMFKRNDKGEYYTMGLCQMYDVYQKHVGDRVIFTEMKSDSTYTDPQSSNERFNIVAMPKGKRELNLILTNNTKHTEFPVKFNFKNKYTLESKTVFTAPNMESYAVNPETEDVFETIVDETKVKNFDSFTMPSKSMVFLKLTADSDLPTLTDGSDETVDEETSYSGEKSFDDIDYCFAKNEILNMAEAGIINGVTDTEFAPEKGVTRAELASMLVRMLGIEETEYNSLFTDVSSADWYSKSIAAICGEGILKGVGNGRFNPDGLVTMEELASIATRIYKTYSDTEADDKNLLNYLDSFKNKEQISPWAQSAVAYAVGNGLLKSMYENGNFIPYDVASRAQTAAILYRLKSKLQ